MSSWPMALFLTGFLLAAVTTARGETDLASWFVSVQENAPLYPTLEDARKNAPADLSLSPPPQDDAFQVLEEVDGWARIQQAHGDGEITQGWISRDALWPLGAYLDAPEYAETVFCPRESSEYTEALNPATLTGGLTLRLDADHDGARLSLRLIPTLRGGGGILEVRDATGALLWRSPDMGPRIVDMPPEQAFFCGSLGFRWPQQVGDLDGDGRAELLVQHPQTEMGPGVYTLLRWNGTAFAPVFTGRQLVLPDKSEGTAWIWRPQPDEGADLPLPASWVDGWPRLDADGVLVAHVVRSESGGDDAVRLLQGLARFRLRGERGDAVFLGWAQDLKPDAEE